MAAATLSALENAGAFGDLGDAELAPLAPAWDFRLPESGAATVPKTKQMVGWAAQTTIASAGGMMMLSDAIARRDDDLRDTGKTSAATTTQMVFGALLAVALPLGQAAMANPRMTKFKVPQLKSPWFRLAILGGCIAAGSVATGALLGTRTGTSLTQMYPMVLGASVGMVAKELVPARFPMNSWPALLL